MVNTRLKRKLESIKRNKYKDSKDLNIYTYINDYISMLLEYFKNNTENTEEAIEDFRDEMFKILRQYTSNVGVRSDLYRYEAAQELLKDRNLLKKIYEKTKDEEDKDNPYIIYSASKPKSQRILIKDSLRVLREQEESMSQEVKIFVEEYRKAKLIDRKKMEENLDEQSINLVRELVYVYEGTEFEELEKFIDFKMPEFEEELKNKLIKFMVIIGEFFEKFGLLEKYQDMQQTTYNILGLGEICQPLYKDKFGKEQVDMNQLFTEDFLKQFDNEQLLILNMFWQNRFAKESTSLNNVLFAIEDFNLLEKEKNGESTELSRQQINGLMNKMGFIRATNEEIMLYIEANKEKIIEQLPKEKIENGVIEFDAESIIEKIVKDFEGEYKKIFDEKLPECENELYMDLIIPKVLHNQIYNVYTCKDGMMINTIRTLYSSKKVKNWGYIKETRDVKDEENILIGIDYEGLNMPIRLHIPKKTLLEDMKWYTKEPIIPIYEGADDFNINGSTIKTHMLIPVTNKYKAELSKKIGETTDSNKLKLLQHLKFIKDDKYPEHLKVEIIQKGKKVKIRPNKKYINLKTGNIFEKKSNEFVKVGESLEEIE